MRPRHFLDGDRVNIVHLDSTRFMARLPDRDKLINEDEQRKLIDATVKEVWHEILQKQKKELAAADFVDRYYDAAISWDYLDLFDDVPLLPRNICSRIAWYPYQEGTSNLDFLEPVNRLISRDEVVSGMVHIVDIDEPCEKNLPHWMYSRARDYLVLSKLVGARHWLRDHMQSLDEEEATVEIIGEVCRTDFEGRWIWSPVVLCEKYAVTINDERVEIDNEGLFHDSLILIPCHESSGEVCHQVSSYVDDYYGFREDELHSDMLTLSDLIRRLRAVDAKATLESMIVELHLEKYPLLQGKTFQLVVGGTQHEHRVALVA